MKLEHIKITNTLGARRVSIAVDAPIMLICGGNGAAKSSINESVRMAFSGEGLRAPSKKEYAQLVSEGAKLARIEVQTDAGKAGFNLPGGAWELSGDLANGLPDALPYVLDAQRFAQLLPEARRTFLFSMAGCKVDPAEIERRMVEDRACAAPKVALVLPLLRAGFPAASEFAKTEATKAKGVWQAVTGERFGAKKGLDWTAPKPEIDTAIHAAATAEYEQTRVAVDLAQERLDGARVGIVHHMATFLHQHRDLLNSMELLDDTAPDSLLDRYRAEYGPIAGASAPLSDAEHRQLLDKLAKAQQEHDVARVTFNARMRDAEAALAADDTTATAANHFKDVAEWTAIADALAPDGIPAELLAQALKPINLALRESSLATGWRQPTIAADMTITAEGRAYELHSVSERWRIDAMIAAAIAQLSGVKILLLDGFDVLELRDRDKLVLWLDGLARAGAISSALVNATLKAPPTSLPETVTGLWVENGELVYQPTESIA
jgi:hypothetical protein